MATTKDYFIWNNERSWDDNIANTNYHLHVVSQPTIPLAQERIQTIDIPGTTGTLSRKEGAAVYSNIEITLSCFLGFEVTEDVDLDAEINKLSKWLRGEGKLILPNRPNGYYKARLSAPISFSQMMRGNDPRSLSLTFSCHPAMYYTSGDEPITIRSAHFTDTRLTNIGNIFAEPIIDIYGTGSCNIMCGDTTLIVDDIDCEGRGHIIIDCESKIVYSEKTGSSPLPRALFSYNVSGSWLKIPEGTPLITITPTTSDNGVNTSIDHVDVTPKWRAV